MAAATARQIAYFFDLVDERLKDIRETQGSEEKVDALIGVVQALTNVLREALNPKDGMGGNS